MANFYTSDLHIGHRNIIKYCNRPFADVDEMNTALVDRWNDAVSDDDTVYVLGDFALGDFTQSLEVGSLLQGRKVLVVGNHDRCFHVSPGKRERMEQRYIDEAGFAEIRHGTTTLQLGEHSVLASHFPYKDEGDSRYVELRPKAYGRTWLLHGHVHDRWKVRAADRMVNVGVDVWDYAPIAEETLVAIIEQGDG